MNDHDPEPQDDGYDFWLILPAGMVLKLLLIPLLLYALNEIFKDLIEVLTTPAGCVLLILTLAAMGTAVWVKRRRA